MRGRKMGTPSLLSHCTKCGGKLKALRYIEEGEFKNQPETPLIVLCECTKCSEHYAIDVQYHYGGICKHCGEFIPITSPFDLARKSRDTMFCNNDCHVEYLAKGMDGKLTEHSLL